MQWFYNPTLPFHMWDKIHLITIAIIISLLCCLYICRTNLLSYRHSIRLTVGISLLVSRLSLDIWYVTTGEWDVRFSLPLELCSIASIACAFMLLTKNRFLFEAFYFIGIAGATQAILTPDLAFGFPQYRYVQFFFDHLLLIAAPILMIWLYDYSITKWSLLKAFITINCIAACTFVLNLILDANYMFLMHKPNSASLLDMLGPYPMYLFALEIIALAIFFLLYVPFMKQNKGHS